MAESQIDELAMQEERAVRNYKRDGEIGSPTFQGEQVSQKYHAISRWTADDVKTLRPDWSLEECAYWLAENERHIQDRLVELGWEVIGNLLPPKTGDKS